MPEAVHPYFTMKDDAEDVRQRDSVPRYQLTKNYPVAVIFDNMQALNTPYESCYRRED